MNKMTSRITIGAFCILMGGMAITSCKKKETVTPPDPIGGFNNSNEVGAASLKAYWGFNNTLNESKSGTAPQQSVGTSYSTGASGSGQSLSLDGSGYVRYPVIAALNTTNVGSLTMSAWIKTSNNGSKATNVLSLTQGTTDQTDWNTGIGNLYLETGKPVTYNDTLVLHSSFSTYSAGTTTRRGGDNINDYGNREVDFKTVKGTGRWVHYVMRYDGAGSFIDLFADGVLVSNNNFRYRSFGSPAVGIGNIVATSTVQALIGGWPTASTGFNNAAVQAWQGGFNGQIDEVRVWYTALSNENISALYQLEKAGR